MSSINSYIPEELVEELDGSLIGGGLCLTPFPNTEDWINAEKPSTLKNTSKPTMHHTHYKKPSVLGQPTILSPLFKA